VAVCENLNYILYELDVPCAFGKKHTISLILTLCKHNNFDQVGATYLYSVESVQLSCILLLFVWLLSIISCPHPE